MKFKTLSGREISKSVYKYRVDWGKKERSQFQTDVKLFLQPYIRSHIVYAEFPCFGTRLKLDLYDATTNIAYEIQGEQHRKYNKFFSGGSRAKYFRSLQNDGSKSKWCEINNIKLIEIYPEDSLDRESFMEKFDVYL